MESKKTDIRKREPERKTLCFARSAVLVSALAAGPVAGCTPDVNINNIPYDPNATDSGGPECLPNGDVCTARTVDLRESGSSAGSNTFTIGNTVVSFNGLVDEGSTKAAKISLEGCEEKVEDAMKPGETTTLTLKGVSFDVVVNSISYDGAGLKVNVTVSPVCDGPDSGTGGADGGSGGSDSGSGGSG